MLAEAEKAEPPVEFSVSVTLVFVAVSGFAPPVSAIVPNSKSAIEVETPGLLEKLIVVTLVKSKWIVPPTPSDHVNWFGIWLFPAGGGIVTPGVVENERVPVEVPGDTAPAKLPKAEKILAVGPSVAVLRVKSTVGAALRETPAVAGPKGTAFAAPEPTARAMAAPSNVLPTVVGEIFRYMGTPPGLAGRKPARNMPFKFADQNTNIFNMLKRSLTPLLAFGVNISDTLFNRARKA